VLKATLVVPEGHEPVPVYETEGGEPVLLVDGPYLEAGGLQEPLPIVDAEGPFWTASDGSLQAAWPVTDLEEPE